MATKSPSAGVSRLCLWCLCGVSTSDGEAPSDDVKNLQQLAGHLTENWFITKFRKIFARDEMNDDLAIVPARYNGAEDTSEYEEILPTSPP
jgi:hypothetical protein